MGKRVVNAYQFRKWEQKKIKMCEVDLIVEMDDIWFEFPYETKQSYLQKKIGWMQGMIGGAVNGVTFLNGNDVGK
jgi:hypothetical protein